MPPWWNEDTIALEAITCNGCAGANPVGGKENFMDEKMFQELLDKIDSMTYEEYWNFYQEAQKIPDFNPPSEDTKDNC